MNKKTTVLLALRILLLTSIVLNPLVQAVEKRKVLSRNYVGLGVEIYAPYQCYTSENITFSVRIEALEDLKNISVTMFIWGSKSEGYSPWGTSLTVLDVADLSENMTRDTDHNVEIPRDLSLGLIYGILFLDWSVYRTPSWEEQWDKASFRATYVKDKDYEDLGTSYNELQGKYELVLGDLQNTKILMYLFLATTMALALSTVYFAKKKTKAKE